MVVVLQVFGLNFPVAVCNKTYDIMPTNSADDLSGLLGALAVAVVGGVAYLSTRKSQTSREIKLQDFEW